ncbi:MAG: hypothetical protein EPO26_03030 [Chloroflexota bacterium]|nr:MAG: hypothetical protein EPO26_03030 [Chloroflexota bacterium]
MCEALVQASGIGELGLTSQAFHGLIQDPNALDFVHVDQMRGERLVRQCGLAADAPAFLDVDAYGAVEGRVQGARRESEQGLKPA